MFVRGGFTLPEVCVSVGVIIVLAAILLTYISKSRKDLVDKVHSLGSDIRREWQADEQLLKDCGNEVESYKVAP